MCPTVGLSAHQLMNGQGLSPGLGCYRKPAMNIGALVTGVLSLWREGPAVGWLGPAARGTVMQRALRCSRGLFSVDSLSSPLTSDSFFPSPSCLCYFFLSLSSS